MPSQTFLQSSGYVNELVANSAQVAPASTTNYGDVTSIDLTPGTWDISGLLTLEANGATVTSANFGIGTATGNSAAGLLVGQNMTYIAPPSSSSIAGGAISPYTVVITTNTTYYLKLRVAYTVAVPVVYGRIAARRII